MGRSHDVGSLHSLDVAKVGRREANWSLLWVGVISVNRYFHSDSHPIQYIQNPDGYFLPTINNRETRTHPAVAGYNNNRGNYNTCRIRDQKPRGKQRITTYKTENKPKGKTSINTRITMISMMIALIYLWYDCSCVKLSHDTYARNDGTNRDKRTRNQRCWSCLRSSRALNSWVVLCATKQSRGLRLAPNIYRYFRRKPG